MDEHRATLQAVGRVLRLTGVAWALGRWGPDHAIGAAVGAEVHTRMECDRLSYRLWGWREEGRG